MKTTERQKTIEEHRRTAQREFMAREQRLRSNGRLLVVLAVLGWGWVVLRFLFADSKGACDARLYHSGAACVDWSLWAELTLVLLVSLPMAVAGTAMYMRATTAQAMGHHAVTMARYLIRAEAAGAAEKAADAEKRGTAERPAG